MDRTPPPTPGSNAKPAHLHQAAQPTAPAPAPDQLLRIDDVERLTGIRKSSLYAKIKTGGFPCPVRITARSVAWPSSRVQAWIQARIAEADQQQGGIA